MNGIGLKSMQALKALRRGQMAKVCRAVAQSSDIG